MDILKGNLGENREKGAKPRDKNEEQKMQSEDKSPGSNKNVSKKGESLCDEYDESKMIFKKYHCQSNKRGEQVFLASIFISLEQKKIKYKFWFTACPNYLENNFSISKRYFY